MRDELNDALTGLRQVHGRMVQKLMANPDYRAMLTVESSISALSGLLTQPAPAAPVVVAPQAPAPAPAPAPIALAMITPEVERSIEATIEEEVVGNILPHAPPKPAMPFVPRQHATATPLARHIGG